MSIQFRCDSCNGKLSAGNRKAGREIICPKCGQSTLVPSRQDSKSGEVTRSKEKTLAVVQRRPPPVGKISSPTEKHRSHTSPVGLSQSAIYSQALILILTAVGAFYAGYRIGQGSRTEEVVKTSSPVQETGSFMWQGEVTYTTGDGRPEGDEGALVMAWPENAKVPFPLSSLGLRASDEDSTEGPALEQVDQLGGGAARVDAQGGFSLVLPQPGSYWVLIVSKHALRSREAPIVEEDLARLADCFQSPAEILGLAKYQLFKKELSSKTETLRQTFGRNER